LRLAPREAQPQGSGFGGRLNFGDFALAAQETRVSGMAGRYAQALFALCEERGTELFFSTDHAAVDLAIFAELAAASPVMQRFIKSPVFSAEEQVKGILVFFFQRCDNALVSAKSTFSICRSPPLYKAVSP
jgi:ATP synthase delta (OSCP) subunit